MAPTSSSRRSTRGFGRSSQNDRGSAFRVRELPGRRRGRVDRNSVERRDPAEPDRRGAGGVGCVFIDATSAARSHKSSGIGAPAVSAPRDVRPFAPAPCSGPLEAAGLARTSGSLRPERLRCWPRASAHARIEEGPRRRGTPRSQSCRRGTFSSTPTEFGSSPCSARRWSAHSRRRIEQSAPDDVSCTVTVGTAAEPRLHPELLRVRASGPDGQRRDDPCGRGVRVAERIVASLPPLPGK